MDLLISKAVYDGNPPPEQHLLFFLSKGNLQFEDEEGEDTAAAPPPPEAEGKAAAPAYSGSTTVVHPYLSSFVNYTHPQKFQVHLTLTHLSEITSDMKKLADDNWINQYHYTLELCQ